MGGILAASSGVKNWAPIEDPVARGALGIGGTVLILLGVGLWLGERRPNQGSKTTNQVPSVERLNVRILSHIAGDHIDFVGVRGTTEKNSIPAAFVLRVLRGYPTINGFIPESATTVDEHGGAWQAMGIDIGGNPGDRRWIDVWLIGEDGRALLKCREDASEVDLRR